MKSTLNGTTTCFVGAHYEVTGSQITKYYFAGSQRVAMRKYTIPQPMTVEYYLGDHLGSTSITTDKDGVKVSEMRYKPWGEVRYSWTAGASTTPAYKLPDYTFTGQFSHMDDPSTGATEGFGLLFYQSRFYDPALGRFTSADTIIPPGVQGLDRYAAMNNNPVRYTDPTGHVIACEADEDCKEVRRRDKLSFDEAYAEAVASYGVSVGAGFSRNQKIAILLGILYVGQKLVSEGKGETAAAAFKAVFYKGISFDWDPQCDGCRHGVKQIQDKNGNWVDMKGKNAACGSDYTTHGCVPGGGLTNSMSSITFASMSGEDNDLSRMVKNVVHELGHAFYHATGDKVMGNSFSRDALRPNVDGRLDWQQHPGVDGWELFADTFIAWTYDAWNTDPSISVALAVNNAQTAMNGWLP